MQDGNRLKIFLKFVKNLIKQLCLFGRSHGQEEMARQKDIKKRSKIEVEITTQRDKDEAEKMEYSGEQTL